MNFFSGLVIGLIAGWVIEWIIDWLFWRRDDEKIRQELADSQAKALEMEKDNEQAQAAAKTAEAASKRLQQQLEETQAAAKAAEAENEQLQLRREEAQAAARTVEAEKERLQQELEEAQAAAKTTEAENEQLQLQREEVQAAARTVEAEKERLQQELEEGQAAAKTAEAETEQLRQQLEAAQAAVMAAGAGVASRSGPVIEVPKVIDKLENVSGIGAVFAKRFNEGGIYSFAELADLTPERVREIINPEEWQKIDAKSWIAQAATFSGKNNRLEKVSGIGAVFARKFNEAGITTFAGLADLTPERVRDIIKPEEWQKIEPESWIAQANVLAGRKSETGATGS